MLTDGERRLIGASVVIAYIVWCAIIWAEVLLKG